MTDVLMPALSPTMEEGTLAKWHVKKGDAVRSGDVIAEIETDKATMEVEAVDEGVVEEILVPEGAEAVKVNTPIARLSGDGAASAKPTTEAPPAQSAGDPEKKQPEEAKPETIQLAILSDGSYNWNGQAVTDAELEQKLQAEATKEPQPELHIRGARDVLYEKVAQAMAAAQRSNIKKIGFITDQAAK